VLCGLKGFKITSFDKKHAESLGISVTFWSYLLLGLASVSTVFSFESVGAIMVIGLLVIPASVANIMTRKLKHFLIISSIFGVLSSIIGHLIAISLDIPTVPTIGVFMGLMLIFILLLQSVEKWRRKATSLGG
jgi:manganese/zinc/iron transport system permease protein